MSTFDRIEADVREILIHSDLSELLPGGEEVKGSSGNHDFNFNKLNNENEGSIRILMPICTAPFLLCGIVAKYF